MDREIMIQIAERNLKKAKKALFNNSNRSGVTQAEIEILSNKVEYTQYIYDAIIANKI